MAGHSDTTTSTGTLQVTEAGLIGTCFAVAAIGLVVLTSPGSSSSSSAPTVTESKTVAQQVAEPAPAVVEPDADTFGAQVRAYLLENPEVIFEAVAVFEQRTAAAQADMDQAILAANAEALFNDGHSWVGGNPDGDITLVKFSDYRCGFCQRAHLEVMSLLEADGNIRLIVKEFPILGAESELASRFAVAVLNSGGSDAYAVAYDRLLRHDGPVTPEFLEDIAVTLELDFDAITAEMSSDATTAILTENRALAQRLQISGTPTFVMETEMIRGFVEADTLLGLAEMLRE